MKKIICFSLLASLLFTIFSCSKKNERIKIQPHDENRMMKEMHIMMNKMETTPMPGDPDHHFAKMMQLHHEGAIKMVNIVLAEGKDETIKKIAQKMKEAQTMEIASLQEFLNTHKMHDVNQEFNMKMEMSMGKMGRNADLQIINGNLDHDFAILIIFHHQSAIEMADLVIHYGHEPVINKMAKMMKEDQEMEIKELQEWLLRNR